MQRNLFIVFCYTNIEEKNNFPSNNAQVLSEQNACFNA